MKLHEVKSILRAHPRAVPRFTLPDGEQIPAHFHITEVGHVTKRFIDCGGKLHDKRESCVLQTWLGSDTDHRIDAATFGKILDLGAQVLPDEEMEVEVEYDCCVVAQYPIGDAKKVGEFIEFQLVEKHTDCLARHRRRDADASKAAEETACC